MNIGKMFFGGTRVMPSEQATEPKIQLSKEVIVSDEFREKQNKWLEVMFGRNPCAFMVGNILVAHPDIIDSMKRQSVIREITS